MKRSAVLADLETMWQAASRDNRRMVDTVRQTDRKLEQHLQQCSAWQRADLTTAGDVLPLDDATDDYT